MTVSTFFSSAADGRILSQNATYATARAGAALSADATSAGGGTNVIGQTLSGNYFCYECFLDFDTSSIPDGDAIESVLLSVYGQFDETPTEFTIEARLHDWGTTLETTDWVAGADLGTKTLLATFGTTGFITTGYNDLTSDAAFVSNINKTGVTRLLLCSSRHRNGDTPTGNERVGIFMSEQAGTSQDPKLVVTHSGAAASVWEMGWIA